MAEPSTIAAPNHLHNDQGDVVADDSPMSLPDSNDTGEGGKIKMIIQLVKKCLGVKDIASMRLSLPASLMEPIPNLEYWNYLDRPDLFAAINDSEDPLERMLAVLRFSLSKELKFIKGKVCKPYNSVLGEHFRAHWDVPPVSYPESPLDPPVPAIRYSGPSLSSSSLPNLTASTPQLKRLSEVESLRSGESLSSRLSFASKDGVAKSASTAATSLGSDAQVRSSSGSIAESVSGNDERVRVVFLTEQVSHHPPVSAFYASCPARGLELQGIDQITAKVSGTSLRVAPGSLNKGMFMSITQGHGEGESYHITHPVAHVNGILRGSFYVTIGESAIITCAGGKRAEDTRYRAIVEYKEESWLGKAHFLVEGVIHTYTPGENVHEGWTKVKHVPEERVVAVFDGCWRHQIRWRRVNRAPTSSIAASPVTPAKSFHLPIPISSSSSSGSTLSLPSPTHLRFASATSSASTPTLSGSCSPGDNADGADEDVHVLIDLAALEVVPKTVRPLERQLPNESRRLWEGVTSRLLRKEYGDATKEKIRIEQRQRDDAAERKRRGLEFVPTFFEKDMSEGKSELTAEGWKAVEELLRDETPCCDDG